MLNVSHSQQKGPKFGWNKDTVHVERIKLSKGDMAKDGTPTDSFVRNVAPFLGRESSEDPGFVVIENTRRLLGKAETSQNFMSELCKRIMPSLFDDSQSANQDFHSVVRPEIDGLTSFKWLHWDGNGSNSLEPNTSPNLLAIRYGPFKHIQGGVPFLADVVDYMDDFELDMPGVLGGNDNGVIVHTDHHYGLLETHAHVFDELDYRKDAPILIWNNEFPKGVAHGATHPDRLTTIRKATRPLLHVATEPTQAVFIRKPFLRDA